MLFDDASSQFLRKATAINAFSVSFWFKPDDLGIDSTMWCISNAAGTAFFRVRLLGSSLSDRVEASYSTAGPPSEAFSVAGATLNEWNHVYAARGILTSTPYVSLNGEALQNGFTSAFSGTPTATQLGRRNSGVGTFNQYYSGQIAAFGAWDDCLNDYDDRWKSLYRGVPPWEIPADPSASIALLNFVSDTKLMGNINDDVSGAAAWLTSSSPTVVADYPRIVRSAA